MGKMSKRALSYISLNGLGQNVRSTPWEQLQQSSALTKGLVSVTSHALNQTC